MKKNCWRYHHFTHVQALAYEASDRMRMPLHTPKTLETWKKKAHFVWLKNPQGVQQITRLKQQQFLSFTFYKAQRSYKKIICIYFLLHWLSGENCIMFTFSSHTIRQTSTDLKIDMNDGTFIFLMSLFIILTWNILLLFSFWHKIISCFK